MKLEIPNLSLVVLIGPSGSGKSTFARRHFKPTEVLSSDACRGLVSDDENDQSASTDAFDVLRYIAGKRLARGLLTVVDATNVQDEARKPFVALAREYHCIPVAIVLDVSPKVCVERNAARPDRDFGAHVVTRQASQLRSSIKHLKREGFRHVHLLSGEAAIDRAVIERVPLWNDRRAEHGPFNIIGDVHGCFGELCTLLERLGYEVECDPNAPAATPPIGRKAIFLGDLVDRGPATPAVLRLVMGMVAAGHALCVPGNHDVKLMRKLRGRDVQIKHGLAESLAQLEPEPETFKNAVADFIDGLVSHYVLDDGNLVVAHAGLRADLQGRGSGAVREFALYGETTGEIDDYGLPVRYDWASEYRGRAMVVYGHTPVPSADWVNRTLCIDTGCVFGGALSALRYPERELVAVEAERIYYEPARPLQTAEAAETRPYHDLLDIQDVSGKRVLTTRLHSRIGIREQHTAAALEHMGRFAIDPRWLIYLPPTMSPPATAPAGAYLERPCEAFDYFTRNDVREVLCEEKHMGSRAVLVVCRDQEAARRRFAVDDGRSGIVYTRTGRPFFSDGVLEAGLLERVRAAITAAGWWERLATDWLCLDAELMPWSAKAQELLKEQYAAVGCAATRALQAAAAVLELTQARLEGEQGDLAEAQRTRLAERAHAADGFVTAYRRYCWPVNGLDDLKIAPFHLLASEGRVYVDRDHAWHMDTLGELAQVDPELFTATNYRPVDLADTASVENAIGWWEAITAGGSEGMVVKPMQWIVRGKRGLVQPAIKCRGAEYLRIIYGPEYLSAENLERLRPRGLGTKRALAVREFALGIEALHRFVEREPLYRVHECVFGVLALESEPVDPRL